MISGAGLCWQHVGGVGRQQQQQQQQHVSLHENIFFIFMVFRKYRISEALY